MMIVELTFWSPLMRPLPPKFIHTGIFLPALVPNASQRIATSE